MRSERGPGGVRPLIWPPSRRRGTVFNYYMMYLLLTGMMLSTAGITLHLVLRTGVRDDALNEQSLSLARLERRVRQDERDSLRTECRESTISFVHSDNLMVDWTAENNMAHRTARQGDLIVSRDQFPMHPSAIVSIQKDDEQLAVIRITERALPRHVTEAAPPENDSDGKHDLPGTAHIEIVIPLSSGSEQGT